MGMFYPKTVCFPKARRLHGDWRPMEEEEEFHLQTSSVGTQQLDQQHLFLQDVHSAAILLFSSIPPMCGVFFICQVCRGHKYSSMQKMWKEGSYVHLDAFSLPCHRDLMDWVSTVGLGTRAWGDRIRGMAFSWQRPG